jgi:hypothetical protein
MATITIKDLTESTDLDRQAMAAITGGARIRGRQGGQLPSPGKRIIDYPAGFKSPTAKAGGKPAK